MYTKKLEIIQGLCHNGTRSCPVSVVLSTLQVSPAHLAEILDNAPFSYRIGKNINGVPLLVIEDK